jgi:hypothetical protein
LNQKASLNPRVQGPREVRPMKVDFQSAARAFEDARSVVETRFLR